MKFNTFTVEDVRGCLHPQPVSHADMEAAHAASSSAAAGIATARAESSGRSDVIAGLPAPRVATHARAPGPRLIGERAHRFYFVAARRVDYLEVDGNYVTIHVGANRYLTRTTLKHLSDVLAPYDFLRIDRSLLVNLRQVAHVERLESGQFAFCLRRGQRLVSSRERSGAIVRLLRAGVL